MKDGISNLLFLMLFTFSLNLHAIYEDAKQLIWPWLNFYNYLVDVSNNVHAPNRVDKFHPDRAAGYLRVILINLPRINIDAVNENVPLTESREKEITQLINAINPEDDPEENTALIQYLRKSHKNVLKAFIRELVQQTKREYLTYTNLEELVNSPDESRGSLISTGQSTNNRGMYFSEFADYASEVYNSRPAPSAHVSIRIEFQGIDLVPETS